MLIQVALGFLCVAFLSVSCKSREYNSSEVKKSGDNLPGICDKFLNESQEKKADAIYECKNSDNTLQVCLQVDKGLLGKIYKVNYQALYSFKRSTGTSSYAGDTFNVPNLMPLDNLTTSAEAPDASSLDVIARRINGNGNGGFGYLAETRLEFRNSFATVRAVRSDFREKNPTPTTPRDTVFDIEASTCKKMVIDSGNTGSSSGSATGSSTGTGSIPDGISPESAKYKCLTRETTRIFLSRDQCIQVGCPAHDCYKAE
jgi:hypothetical protein